MRREGKDKFRLNKIEIRALLQQKQLDEAERRLADCPPAADDSEMVTLRAIDDWLNGRQATALEKTERALEMDGMNVDAKQLRETLMQQGKME